MSGIIERPQPALRPDIDVIDLLAGLRAGGAIAALRGQRDEVRAATQGSFAALFCPANAGGLPRHERELAALRVAALQQDEGLVAFHRRRAERRGAGADLIDTVDWRPAHAGDGDRFAQLFQFVDRLTLDPAAARPVHLRSLLEAGFAVVDVVTLAQLVAFVNCEVRLLAGLRALQALGAGSATSSAARQAGPTRPVPRATALPAGETTPVATPPSKGRFTLEALQWQAWLTTVDPARATQAQLAVLDESQASARSSPYYLTLVHEPEVLRQRSKLFNAIMYGPGGLPRAERELVAVAVSRINGCPYCASVHARAFAQLTKEPEVVERLLADGVNVPLAPRRRAVVDLAVDLSANPPALTATRLAPLRAAGLSDLELLDTIHAAAIFAWANRLMQTLGEPV